MASCCDSCIDHCPEFKGIKTVLHKLHTGIRVLITALNSKGLRQQNKISLALNNVLITALNSKGLRRELLFVFVFIRVLITALNSKGLRPPTAGTLTLTGIDHCPEFKGIKTRVDLHAVQREY